jgi:acyl-CoA thioester hydrolase
MKFTYRVYYEDTDAGGIVYYANYLKFAERARTDALRALGIQQSQLRAERGLIFVVTRVEVDYRRPARLDDEITVETLLRDIAKVRMSMLQRICRDDTVLAELVVELAAIGENGRAVPVPEDIAEMLRRITKGE